MPMWFKGSRRRAVSFAAVAGGAALMCGCVDSWELDPESTVVYEGEYSAVVERCARVTYSFDDLGETVGVNVVADDVSVSSPELQNGLELVTVAGTSTARNSGTRPDLVRDWTCRIDVGTVGKSYITVEYGILREVE